MLKIAICDDRKEDRDTALEYTRQFLQENKLEADIRVFEHPDDMIGECEKFQPHIYILDIVMPMVSGIEAARELRWNQPDAQIIFATSEESFALESFDVNPINYIVKPIHRDKLWETLTLALRRVDLTEEKTITVKVKGGYSSIILSNIMYIDYHNHVVTYHMFSGEEISTTTLRIGFGQYLREMHGDSLIIQCHESVAVYLPAIDKLTRNEIRVRNKEVIPVSKSKYQMVAEEYMNYRFA